PYTTLFRSGIEMLDLEERGVLAGRLVDAKMAHDAECGRTFERAAKGRAGSREIGLVGPARELRRRQEKAAGMRVVHALERHRPADRRRTQPRLAVVALRPEQAAVARVAVYVNLVGNGIVGQL